jgi:hypothetical protein
MAGDMILQRCVLFVVILCIAGAAEAFAVEAPVKAEIVNVSKIWDEAPHNAFTDLVRFKDQWYCAFREGKAHVSKLGKLRVLRSANGEKWESAALLEHPEYDLRDAAISVTPDGRLMISGGAQQATKNSHPTGTVVSFSDDGADWTPPQVVFPLGQWLWRVTWHGDKAYGFAYAAGPGGKYSLEVTADGVHFDEVPLADQPPAGGRLTEARIRFDDDGTAYCLQRRDGAPNSALWGKAAAPYRDWRWQDMGMYFGGPNFIKTPDGDFVGAGRIIEGPARTDVTWINPETGEMVSLLTLPSGGDCSYPGMVWHNDLLWISYYSSHEGRTSIYLAKVRITPK